MSQQRELSQDAIAEAYQDLSTTYEIFERIVREDSETVISNTMAETCLIGIYKNLHHINGWGNDRLISSWKRLLNSPSLQPDQLKEGLAITDSLNARATAARDAFSE